MLRLPGLVRIPAGSSAFRGQLTSFFQQTASVCSVCSALVQQARQQQQLKQQQSQLQQQLEKWQHLHHRRHRQLLLPPARLLQQTTDQFPSKSWTPPVKTPKDSSGSHWTYTGEHGVEHWGKMFPECNGHHQSPVNIDTLSAKDDKSLTPFAFSNFDTVDGIAWMLQNNGHSAQVTYTDGKLTVAEGGLSSKYEVVQFHFHWGGNDSVGSEHTIDGQHYPMEMHIVMYNTDYGDMTNASQHGDGLAVLGMFFKVAPNDNANFTGLISALSQVREAGSETTLSPINLRSLMPADRDKFCRYSGSLTTPPCSEVVTWTLFRDEVPISSSQLDAFRSLKDSEHQPLVNNFRPVQPLNERSIKCNF